MKVQGKVGDVHSAKHVRYRFIHSDDAPAEFLPDSVAQTVIGGKGKQAELDVWSVNVADRDLKPPRHEQRPTKTDREPNNWIQSDDRRIVAMASRVEPDQADPKAVAMALEKLVHESITEKDFSTALATAVEVAETLQGDCTEHAMLLAALARARGIPARVVVGLVYVPGLGGFGYHMWNEVWTGKSWNPLDATLARGGTGPGHIKLGHANMANADSASIFLPVLQVMGRVKIEVLEVKR